MLSLTINVSIYLSILILTLIISRYFKFFDIPGERKIHKKKILNVSGISTFIFLMYVVSTTEYSARIENIIIAGLLIVIIGFIDDRINLSPITKLISIFFPIFFLINNEFYITDLGYYEQIGKIYLGKFGIIFTILSVALLTNSYNYIDGLDGLLCGITISSLTYLIYLILYIGDADLNIVKLLQTIIIPLSINIIFNFLPSTNKFKTFMGNGGSLFIGFFISFLLIYMYKIKGIDPAYLIWACWYPVYDFLYVTFYRIKKNKKFFKADKMHFHHKVLKLNRNSHLKSFFIINLLNIIIIILGFIISIYFGQLYSLITYTILFIFLSLIRFKFIK